MREHNIANPTARALDLFVCARQHLEQSPFASEIRWQATRRFPDFSETEFLREAAWVILCSGFREAVVRRNFAYISLCFCDWESAQVIAANANTCRSTALAGFHNPRKIGAIIQIAFHITKLRFPTLRSQIWEAPISTLRTLPFVGPVTAFHLAKNLGFDVAKPDRHLKRLANSMGFSSPQELCQRIADAIGQPVRVVDIILWRYCERGLREVGLQSAVRRETEGLTTN